MNKLYSCFYFFIVSCIFATATFSSDNPDDILLRQAAYEVLMQEREQLKKKRLPVFIDPKSLESGSLPFWNLMQLNNDIETVDKNLAAIRADLENDKNNRVKKSDE